MLPTIPNHSLNLILGKADRAVDLYGVDNAVQPPAFYGSDSHAEVSGDFFSGEESLLGVHASPKINSMLFLVSDCSFDILLFSRSDPHCLVRPTNLDISARLNR